MSKRNIMSRQSGGSSYLKRRNESREQSNKKILDEVRKETIKRLNPLITTLNQDITKYKTSKKNKGVVQGKLKEEIIKLNELRTKIFEFHKTDSLKKFYQKFCEKLKSKLTETSDGSVVSTDNESSGSTGNESSGSTGNEYNLDAFSFQELMDVPTEERYTLIDGDKDLLTQLENTVLTELGSKNPVTEIKNAEQIQTLLHIWIVYGNY